MAPLHASLAIPPHPNGIKPSGNFAMASKGHDDGYQDYFRRLPDEIILSIYQTLDRPELVALSHTCKRLYAFSLLEDLWKDIYTTQNLDLPWRGSWRSSCLQLQEANAPIDVGNVYSDLLYRPYMNTLIDLRQYLPVPGSNIIPRYERMSLKAFAVTHVHRPFILTREIEAWPALREWTTERLLEAHGKTKFRAECVDWDLERYVSYMRTNQDESPLYLFDSHFAQKTRDEGTERSLDSDYTVPECFDEDAFKILRNDRPDHKWLIVGPARSGSTFHKDPNGTCAWNAVVTGSKLWIMLPPDSPPPGVFVNADESEVTAPLSIAEWLATYHGAARSTKGFMEGICNPGEILYVPSGWWHLVVNLEECIAVTQNFVPKAYVGKVLRFLQEKREQVSGFDKSIQAHELFVERLQTELPSLLTTIEQTSSNSWKRLKTAAHDPNAAVEATFAFSFVESESESESGDFETVNKD